MLIMHPSESGNLRCNKLETSRKLPFGLWLKRFIILHGLKEADSWKSSLDASRRNHWMFSLVRLPAKGERGR